MHVDRVEGAKEQTRMGYSWKLEPNGRRDEGAGVHRSGVNLCMFSGWADVSKVVAVVVDVRQEMSKAVRRS